MLLPYFVMILFGFIGFIYIKLFPSTMPDVDEKYNENSNLHTSALQLVGFGMKYFFFFF